LGLAGGGPERPQGYPFGVHVAPYVVRGAAIPFEAYYAMDARQLHGTVVAHAVLFARQRVRVAHEQRVHLVDAAAAAQSGRHVAPRGRRMRISDLKAKAENHALFEKKSKSKKTLPKKKRTFLS
jgi:hypothetical protein